MLTEHRPQQVIVVDDEKTIATTLATILSRRGYDARSYVDPLEALSSAKLRSPQLVITDVVMPGMSGVELAMQLTEHCPGCKVLLFSGQAQTNDLLAEARSQGHNFQLLTKPIHPEELLKVIKSTLD